MNGINVWKPNAAVRSLLRNDTRGCAYIMRDGIVFCFDRRSRKEDLEYQELHVFEHEVPFLLRGSIKNDLSYQEIEALKPRIVLHDSGVLLYGLRHVEVWYGNTCESMERSHLVSTTVVLVTADGIRLSDDQIMDTNRRASISGPRWLVQPDPVADPFSMSWTGIQASIRTWDDKRWERGVKCFYHAQNAEESGSMAL